MGKNRLVRLEGRLVPPLSDVTSREDFLAREHFEDFRRIHMPTGVTPSTLSSAFRDCVDKDPEKYPGLTVVTREELGWRRWDDGTVHPKTLLVGQFAVQTGSLIDIVTPHLAGRDNLNAKEQFLSGLLVVVNRQLL